MSTTDNCIQYDVKFINHLSKWLDLTDSELETLKKFTRLGFIQRDRIVEQAIANAGGLDVVSIEGQDVSDGTEVKSVVSNSRNNNIKRGQWKNSFNIRNLQAKTGDLRIVAYNKLLDRFHYFYIPREEYQHLKKDLEIILEQYNTFQEPTFTGVPRTHLKWWNYECDTFEQMAQRTCFDLAA